MAPIGHSSRQSPQAMQASSLITSTTPSPTSSTPCGHASTQMPQPIQVSSSTIGRDIPASQLIARPPSPMHGPHICSLSCAQDTTECTLFNEVERLHGKRHMSCRLTHRPTQNASPDAKRLHAGFPHQPGGGHEGVLPLDAQNASVQIVPISRCGEAARPPACRACAFRQRPCATSRAARGRVRMRSPRR